MRFLCVALVLSACAQASPLEAAKHQYSLELQERARCKAVIKASLESVADVSIPLECLRYIEPSSRDSDIEPGS